MPRAPHCGFKYHKGRKSWGFYTKNFKSDCMPSKSSIHRHLKIDKQGRGGMQGHFGRLRANRKARMRMVGLLNKKKK